MRKFGFLALAATAILALAACDKTSGGEAPKGEASSTTAGTEASGKIWTDTVSKTAEGGYAIGNPNAKVKLVEYLAVTCSHCAEFEETGYPELIGDFVNKGTVNLEIRNFLLNPYDIPISLLTRCSDDAAYLPLTQKFYQNQKTYLTKLQSIEPAKMEGIMKLPDNQRFYAMAQAMGILEFFKESGISDDQAKSCLSNPESAKQLIAMTEKGAKELKVSGTPTFFLNGTIVENTNWPQLKVKLKEAGA
jgi:protein-disulfide isomerase